MLNNEEKEKCKTSTGLFKVLIDTFKCNIMRGYYHCNIAKLVREQKRNNKEWMGDLRMKANKCSYMEKDERLKEQFINGINNDMMTEIIR